jgi:fatty acid desaturase (delta-4 desaturase)
MALIGLNVQHDANHGAASRTVWINDVLGLGADLIGGSKWLWMQKHWTHHAYTNHHEKDPDGFAAEPFVLFNPPSDPSQRRPFHAYQAFYLVVILSGYWASAVLDFPMIWKLQDGGAVKVGMRLDNSWINSRRVYAITLRTLYFLCNIVIPLYNDFSLSTLGHIWLMGVAGSLTLGCLFTLSHNFEGAERDPTQKTRETGELTDWFKAQVETSSTYGGFVSGCLTGGLNFQVEHHLFPRMSSAWYPYIAPKVREICKKHGVKYAYYPWLWQNMWSTLTYTHQIGTGSGAGYVMKNKAAGGKSQ